MSLAPNKIVIKYIGILLCIAIVPLLLIGWLSYQASSSTLLESENRFARTLLKNQSERLALQLEQVENLIANISGVEAITQALDDRDVITDTYTNLATQARIGYILNGYLNLRGLVSIDIFTEGGAHYHVGDRLDAGEIRAPVRDLIRREALQSGRQIYWAGVLPNVHEASSDHYVLTAARILSKLDRRSMQQRPIALVVVNYSLDYLAQQFLQVESMAGSQLALLDQRSNIIYSSAENQVGQPAAGMFAYLLQAEQSPQGIDWQGQRYLVQQQFLPKYGWHMQSIIPEQALLEGVKTVRKITVLLLLLGVVFVALAAWQFTRNILTPIRDVIGGFQLLQADRYDMKKRLSVRTDDELGELTQWFNSFLDNLAARHASEAALRESERRYALVVNASHESLWDWDLQSDTLYLSPRFMALIGLDPSSARLSNSPHEWFSRIHPEDLATVKQEIEQHLAGNSRHFEREYRLRQNDGGYRWVLSYGLAERDAQDQAVRMAGSHTDISNRKEAEHQLRHDAFHDALTGLSNRAWFVSYLQQKLNTCRRNPEELFAVLFLDLDHFKRINDSLGHAAGDELLIQIAERLQECLRSTDLLARLGGDEFVILLEHTDDYHYANVADRILSALARPFVIQDQEVLSGVSIGITLSAAGYQDPDAMLRDADIAMYQAKLSGKNRYVLFDGRMREQLLQRIALEHDLKEALAHDRLELYYQPIVSLEDRSLVGCEALIRWQHPSLGMISPEAFIPIAESSDLIYSLGQWVLDTACKQWQAWQQACGELDGLRLSLNLSPKQFNDQQFIANLPKTLALHGVRGADLAFEITETAIIRDARVALRVIDEIKRLGISIHLDDFGTGYSSLSHLSDFPIDLIKIDRSFVMSCSEQKKYNRLVRGILNMAQELDIQCIAEGVETHAQWSLLKQNQCALGQGYLFSKPLSAAAMHAEIARHLQTARIS